MSDPLQPHPEELLAELVDDPAALSPEDREVVESHLASCERCRDDLALAQRGSAAMGLLEEVPVPLGVTGPVLSKVRAERPWMQRFGRPVAAAAAAAAIFIGGFAILNNLGSSDDADSGLEAQDAGGTGDNAPEAAGGVPMEVYDRDLSSEELQALADEEANAVKMRASSVAEGGEQTPASEDSAATAPPAEATVFADSGEAMACLANVADLGANDRPVRLIKAGFEGKPAYIGFYAHSPGAGQPEDRVVVWVADAETCAPPALFSGTRRI
jgi:anti-sigma factor RsiW